MQNGLGQFVLSAVTVLVARAALATGLSGAVLSNAELLRTSGNVTGSGFGTSSAAFALSSGSVGVLDWSTLNVAVGETLTFGNGIWYNAVSGPAASEIAGSILGSGAHVYLFNPNGVFFTSGSTIDVGSFTAAGFAMSNLDDLIDDPTREPEFATKLSGAIEASGATFGPDRVNLYGRRVFVEDSSFVGTLTVGAGGRVAVDSVGGGTVSFQVSGASADAAFVESRAGGLEIAATGNVLIESSNDLTLDNISAGKNVTVGSDGAISVVGRIAAKRDIDVTASGDVSWAADGLLRAGRSVRVESEAGDVALGNVSAAKASVIAAGDVTGRLEAGGDLLEKGEKTCATYRIDADGTVLVTLENATVDVRGRQGVTLETSDSLTLAPVAVTTVRLERGTDGKGEPTLAETKVRDDAFGGYQTPASDIALSAPRNLTVNGTIQTLADGDAVRPDSVRLEAGGDIAVGGSVAAKGSLELTAGGRVALGGNPNALVSGDITVTVDAAGNPTRYKGGSESGTLVLTRTRKGSTGRLTSTGAILLVDGSVSGGAPTKVAAIQGLETAVSAGNAALTVREPAEDVNAQLPGETNEVVRDETALVRATKEEEPWMLKNVRK